MRKCCFARELLVSTLVVTGLFSSFAAAQVKDISDPASAAPAALVYQPLSPSGRVTWVVNSIVGPKSLTAGVFSAAWDTAWNSPNEYGPHWDGFAKRYGMRLTAVATGNTIEAGLGKLWGEDPRYFPAPERRPAIRVRHAAAMVFVARRANGRDAPAFARFSGVLGNNFISNTWRAPSESTVTSAMTRSALEFVGKFACNLFEEFWPDVQRRLPLGR